MIARNLLKEFNEKQGECNRSTRNIADELRCSFTTISRFQRTGNIGPHLGHKVRLWVHPELEGTPCPCYQCNNKPKIADIDRLWPEIERRVRCLVQRIKEDERIDNLDKS